MRIKRRVKYCFKQKYGNIKRTKNNTMQNNRPLTFPLGNLNDPFLKPNHFLHGRELNLPQKKTA